MMIRFLKYLACLGFLAAPLAASPSIVQTAGVADSYTLSSMTLTLGASPTVGNLMVIFFGNDSESGSVPTGPSGWTSIGSIANTSNGTGLYAWYRVVQSGDGTSYTITTPGGDFTTGIIYEITGQAAVSPINQHAFSSPSATGTSSTTSSVTPSVLYCLAISAITPNSNAALSSVSSGWTVDKSETNSFHQLFSAHMTAATTSTSTAVSNTFTFASSTQFANAIILIAPAISADVNNPIRM